MILISHLVVGAIIASKLNSIPLIILLALLSHYLLDMIPHVEYIRLSKDNIRGGSLKVAADALIGILLIFLIHRITNADYLRLIIGGFFGILPDILTGMLFLFPYNKILQKHHTLHKKAHFPTEKKYPLSLRISTQLFVVLLGFILII